MGGSRLRIQLTLAPSAEASREARRLLESFPDLEPYPDLLFTAQLLTHELVTNSARHGNVPPRQPVRLTVEGNTETVCVEVAHKGTGFDALAVLAEHYRRKELYHGLFLLDALADRWAFGRDGGCALSFQLDLVPGRRTWRGRVPTPAINPSGAPE
jgi:anti-sigma regulatory factor (Ser/Thr protein kinase)